MAYIIRSDLAYRLGKTEIGYFDDDLNTLRAFFDQSVAYPGTIIRATWSSGTYIPPEVMPRRLHLTRGNAMYDWLDLRAGGTLVSSRVRDAVEELDPGRHQFFPVVVEDKNGVARPGDFFVFNVVGRIDSIMKTEAISGRADAAISRTGATNAASGHGNARWMRPSSAAGRAGLNTAMASVGSFPTGWPRCCKNAS